MAILCRTPGRVVGLDDDHATFSSGRIEGRYMFWQRRFVGEGQRSLELEYLQKVESVEHGSLSATRAYDPHLEVFGVGVEGLKDILTCR